MTTYINRADVLVFIERSLPNEDLADFDLNAIADDVLAACPS